MLHVNVLIDGLRKMGVETYDLERLVTAAGYDLHKPLERVPVMLWGSLWYLARARTQDEAIALRIARQIHIGTWELPDYLAASQATVMDALRFSSGVARSLHDFAIGEFEPHPDGLFVYLNLPPGLPPLLPEITDFVVAACLATCRTRPLSMSPRGKRLLKS